jgi:hypothetical protein
LEEIDAFTEALVAVAQRHREVAFELRMLTARRDDLVLTCREAGLSFRRIAQLAGVSYARVAQICAHSGPVPSLALETDWLAAGPEETFAYVKDFVGQRYEPVTDDELHDVLGAVAECYRDVNPTPDTRWGYGLLVSVGDQALRDRERLDPLVAAASFRMSMYYGQLRRERYGVDGLSAVRARWLDVVARLAVEAEAHSHAQSRC